MPVKENHFYTTDKYHLLFDSKEDVETYRVGCSVRHKYTCFYYFDRSGIVEAIKFWQTALNIRISIIAPQNMIYVIKADENACQIIFGEKVGWSSLWHNTFLTEVKHGSQY